MACVDTKNNIAHYYPLSVHMQPLTPPTNVKMEDIMLEVVVAMTIKTVWKHLGCDVGVSGASV